MTHLDELDMEEFRLVARKLAPHWTDEEFEQKWADFIAYKRAYLARKTLN